YWQVAMEDTLYNGQSLGPAAEGIIDTGTAMVIIGDAAAQAAHEGIEGAMDDSEVGWLAPCSVSADNTNRVSFSIGGGVLHDPLADIVNQEVEGGYCYWGIQGWENNLWILDDVFIRNNYYVFSQTANPSIGIAPLAIK
ncbi:MAG: aspartic peptidase domain-containing protein, partial [Linnemannia gamsii]